MASTPVPPIMPDSILNRPTSASLAAQQGFNNEDLCICDLERFQTKFIVKIKPIAQSGPNCGMAALAMIASTTISKQTVDDIFDIAKCLGFTNNGEMFSAHNMSILAYRVCEPWFQIELLSGGLSSHWNHTVNSLSNGDLMLIPYDADRDHSPCCKNGHKAHWAVVCGILTDHDQIWVAARHGKSRYLAVWPLIDLKLSNDNLTELDPKRESDGNEYVLPEGGVKSGLCSQFILLHRKS